MAKHREALPTLSNDIFITDGGLETVLIFKKGWNLPCNAAFVLLESSKGRKALAEYYQEYLAIARKYRIGFILESPTWCASADWILRAGYPENTIVDFNRNAVSLLRSIRDEHEKNGIPIVISGCIGPRGDGYIVDNRMTASQAESYHYKQIQILSNTEADLVSAFTVNYSDEAIGMASAAKALHMPIVISFTVETDGKLPSGETLGQAIQKVDQATQNACAYYMINCSHPAHIEKALVVGGSWMKRIRGVRSNASIKSHEELNNSTELDEGNPVEFGEQYLKLKSLLPNLNVLGGCCGTNHLHVEEICRKFVKN